MIPVYRLVDNLLLFSRLRLYGDRDVPVYRDPGWSNRDLGTRHQDRFFPYKRDISVHRDEVKWNLKRRATRENLKKKKLKETTFVGMLFMWTKLVFVLLTNYYQLFHAFSVNEIDTSWSPGTTRCTEIIQTRPGWNVSGNRCHSEMCFPVKSVSPNFRLGIISLNILFRGNPDTKCFTKYIFVNTV